MRNLIHSTKDAGTIALGFPLAFLSLSVAAVIMAGAAVVTKMIDRLSR
jgi:hypothetical protein